MSGNQSSRMPRWYRGFRPIDRAFRKVGQRLARHHVLISTGLGYTVLLLIVPLVFLVGLLIHRTHTTYHLLTGPKGSSRDVVGVLMADVLNQATPLERFLHLNVVPDYVAQESCGSLDNLYYLNRGLAQLALVHDGLPLPAGSDPSCPLPLTAPRFKDTHLEMRTRAVFPLFTAPLHIVARRDLKIATLTDLRPSMKIYIGSPGAASAYLARNLLSKLGLPITPYSKQLTYEQSLQHLLDGQLDVGFFLTSVNAQILQHLMQSGRFTLLSVSQASGLHMQFPYLHTVTIPGGTYEGVPHDVVTVGATTILAASTDLTEVEVYRVASKLSQHLHDLMRDIPMNLAKDVDTDPSKDLYYPLHDGAIRFFDHNPPFMFDPRILAGLGTYLSLLYAFSGVSSQYLRKYRVQRVLHAVDRLVRCSGIAARQPNPPRYQAYLRRVLQPALQALRHHRISYEDFQRIMEYVKGHS
jgi:TRAP transporter TAXI family solute receptor